MIKAKIDNNQIKVLTIVLSPEHCGNWENAEKICTIATSALGFDFQLPK